MNYMGSKTRIVKYIVPFMLQHRKKGMTWVEPFVGGGNVIDKVKGKRIGSDIDKYTIQALISIRDYIDELPKNNKEFTEEDYKKLRNGDDYKHKGYAGYAFSFGAKFLGGWARGGHAIDYVELGYNSAKKQSPLLQGVKLLNRDYRKLKIPANSIIYCDPPYENTTKYNNSIDHTEFWEWCRIKVYEGHTVFVSEYKAPKDFKIILKGTLVISFDGNRKNTTQKRGAECLFKCEPIRKHYLI